MKVLVERWQHALGQLLSKRPESFAGTDLDPATVLHKMEKLVLRVEGLAADVDEPQVAHQSQAELLAAKLRSAFASNAMGGRGAEESKSRAAADAVRDAQGAWQRLPPIDSPEAHGYAVRFREACRRVTDRTRRHHGSPSHDQGQPRRQSRAPHERPEAAVV
jgi:hypothetical protein